MHSSILETQGKEVGTEVEGMARDPGEAELGTTMSSLCRRNHLLWKMSLVLASWSEGN